MKKIVMFLSVLLITTTYVKANSSSINWMTSFEDAKKMSKALNKPILLDFTAHWCGPCKMMDSNVWSKEEIKVVMQNFVPLKIDFDSKKDLVRKYNVKGIPYIFIIDGWGNKLHSFIGYKDKNFMLKFLKNFSVNLSTVHQALTILDKSETSVFSNIRVAQKFQDLGFMLTDEARRSFLKCSNNYLKQSEKLTKKEEPKVAEKIELLHLLNKAYFHNFKSVLKKLNKDFKEVDDSNKCLHNYIQFYCYSNIEKKTEADKHYQLLTGSYKKKADYLLSKV